MASYNDMAKGYNELHGEEQMNKLNIIKKNIKIGKHAKLLDVGCGSGISSDFECRVTGIDPSLELLKQFDTAENRKALHGRAENLPFKDNEFDVVLSMTAIHNFDDIVKGMQEMKRVGRKDLVFSILKRSPKFSLIEQNIEKMFKVRKRVQEAHDEIFFLEK